MGFEPLRWSRQPRRPRRLGPLEGLSSMRDAIERQNLRDPPETP